MENTLNIVVKCNECGKVIALAVPSEGYHKWKQGELIQRALPTLSVDDRELLISHICGDCWKILFPPEEEDEFDPNSILRDE